MREQEYFKEMLEQVEIPDVDRGWEKMRELLVSSAQPDITVRRILLRLIGMNVLSGLLLSLFAFYPDRNPPAHASQNPPEHFVNTLHHPLQDQTVLSMRPVPMTPQTQALALAEGQETSRSEIIRNLSPRPFHHFSYIWLPADTLLLRSQLSQRPRFPIPLLQPGIALSYGLFPEVRAEDVANQFGAEAGLRVLFNEYRYAELGVFYCPVSIRSLDLPISERGMPGQPTIRSYQRLNYAGISAGIRQCVNKQVKVGLSFSAGRLLFASGTETQVDPATGTVVNGRIRQIRTSEAQGIRPFDLALHAEVAVAAGKNEVLFGYRQSLTDYSVNEVFKSPSRNSYGQFRLSYHLSVPGRISHIP